MITNIIQRKIMVGVIQMCSSNNPLLNLQKAEYFIQRCKNDGAQLICLPEGFAFMGVQNQSYEIQQYDQEDTNFTSQSYCNFQEDIQKGKYLNKYREIAKQLQVTLSLGGFQEQCALNQQKKLNSHLIISSDGELLTNYRKIHLYDVDMAKYLEGGVSIRESDFIQQGDSLPQVIKFSNSNNLTLSIAPTICYDLRFPEIFRIARLEGAEVILVPSAFMIKTGQYHWEILLRARAIENQCYIVAAAQCGTHNKNKDNPQFQYRQSYGHSMVIDPWGSIIGQIDSQDEENYFVVELDGQKIDQVRQNMPCINQRRTDLYSLGKINDD